PLLALGVAGLPTQTYYVERSRGESHGAGDAFVEVPGASSTRINTQFKTELESLLSRFSVENIVLDTSNTILAKFQAVYLRGTRSTFPSHNLFFAAGAPQLVTLFNPVLDSFITEMDEVKNARFVDAQFRTLARDNEPATVGFDLDI